MRIKPEFINAFANKKFVEVVRRGSIWELEANDFDNAINILMLNNKKAGVKEFQLLKEEFVCSEVKPTTDEYFAFRFVQHLTDVATKRMSDVEARKVKKSIDGLWDTDAMRSIQANYIKVKNAYEEYADYQIQLERAKEYANISEAMMKSISCWMEQEVDEYEGSLENLKENDWEEILHEVDAYEEEIRTIRWK